MILAYFAGTRVKAWGQKPLLTPKHLLCTKFSWDMLSDGTQEFKGHEGV